MVIGGGFIGSEIAAALAMNGQAVTLITPGAGVGDRMFPPTWCSSSTPTTAKKGSSY